MERWGQRNVIEASTDLFSWTAISTNVFPATTCPVCPFIDFQDPASTNLARRFPEKQRAIIMDVCLNQKQLEATPVNEFVDLMVI